MTERTLVVIFFFWAMLTIITPTLILWSESAKTDPDFIINDSAAGERSDGMKVRRMTGYVEQHTRGSQNSAVEAPADAEAPGPGMEPSRDIGNTTLKGSDKQKAESGFLKIQRKMI